MKIRKLILKAKLQQIAQQYPYVFIYHCSGANASQWRQLKDLLDKTQARSVFQPDSRIEDLSLSFLKKESTVHIDHGSKQKDQSRMCRLQNKRMSFAQASNSASSHASREIMSQALLAKKACEASSNVSLWQPLAPKGSFCVIYFNSCEGKEGAQSPASWAEVLKKIDSLGSKNTKLVLLYAQIHSTILNHMDIKVALNLESRSVYQQLLSSMCYRPLESLDFCNHKNVHFLEFLNQHFKSTGLN